MQRIYFDHASTTPVDPAVVQAMTPYFNDRFGNASSPHAFGREAEKALEEARETVASLLGADSSEIIFNSGATEGNNHAVFGVARTLRNQGNHIIVSQIEHHSVLEPVEYLKKYEGFNVSYIKPDADGLIDPGDVKKALTNKTVLIAVMMANNEIGTIQPVVEIGAIAREQGVAFLVDAVQAVGHIPVNVREIHADILTLSAHKCYGPKGVGAAYMRKEAKLFPLFLGGGQERGRRASTQNIAGAVGLSKALEICREGMAQEAERQRILRDMLLKRIPEIVDGVTVNGHPVCRLPNNVHCSFTGLQGEALLMSLDMRGICASMGSACTSGAMEPSHVLRAIGLSDDLAYGSLRITLGRMNTRENIEALLEQLPALVKGLRI